MKVADTIVCDDYVAYCANPDDLVIFAIQGSGDILLIRE